MIIALDDSVLKVQKDGTLIPAKEYAAASEIEAGDMAVYMLPGN